MADDHDEQCGHDEELGSESPTRIEPDDDVTAADDPDAEIDRSSYAFVPDQGADHLDRR